MENEIKYIEDKTEEVNGSIHFYNNQVRMTETEVKPRELVFMKS